MPRRLSEEEKMRKEEEKMKRKAETAERRSQTMKEMNKKKTEEVKQLKTDLKECHHRVAQLTHPKMLPIHTIEKLRNIEEETKKRNEARMITPKRLVSPMMEMMAKRRGMTIEQYEKAAREQAMKSK